MRFSTLYRSGDGEDYYAGSRDDCTGSCILSVGCRGDGYRSVSRCKRSGGRIVGVSRTLGERRTVKSYRNIAEHRVKRVADDKAAGGFDGRVAEVLHYDRIGDLLVIRDYRRADSLCNS